MSLSPTFRLSGHFHTPCHMELEVYRGTEQKGEEGGSGSCCLRGRWRSKKGEFAFIILQFDSTRSISYPLTLSLSACVCVRVCVCVCLCLCMPVHPRECASPGHLYRAWQIGVRQESPWSKYNSSNFSVYVIMFQGSRCQPL